MLVSLYWKQVVMSLGARFVFMPAHLPTWDSYPSAPTTHPHLMSFVSPNDLTLTPVTLLPDLSSLTAEVFSTRSAPAFAASWARSLSKKNGSGDIPAPCPALLS